MQFKTFLSVALVICTGFLHAQVRVTDTRVENLTQPLSVDVKPRFGWKILSEDRGILQEACEIKVAESSDNLYANKLYWTSGKVTSSASQWVEYAGKELQSGRKYWWQVRVWDNRGNVSDWSEPAFWRMGLLGESDWKAGWITVSDPEDSTQPSPMFRREFGLTRQVRSAMLYITAHGLYEAKINGKRVGDAFLTPGWTAYQKRLQYQAFDVTSLLNADKNALAVTLGSGWWRGNIGFSGQRNFYGKDVSLLCMLVLEFADGSTATISTDSGWKYTTDGPVRSSEVYHGETYNSGMEIPGWDKPGFDDRNWKPVKVVPDGKDKLVATANEYIKKHEVFSNPKIFRTPAGELVADFGQNLVGWAMLTASGKKGDTIKLQFAEVLDKNGNFYIENLRGAQCTDRWILSGQAGEHFEPHFTFHGFRYVKIDGYPGILTPGDISAVALYSDMKPAGTFTCSDSLVNQLQHNIQWGQRGNFLDVPTDCPQRDERLGWTGDAQAFSRTAMFNFDVHNFFTKWLKDVAADQNPDGSVPFVVPNVLGAGASASTGWADVSNIIPWNAWLAYGDKRILEDQYPSMKAWVEYMRSKSVNNLWNTGFHFGDWLFYRPEDDNDGRSAVTDKYLIAQCFYAHSTQLLINAAAVLGKNSEADEYRKLLEGIKFAFMNEYVTPNGRIASPTQTAYVLALQFDMLPEYQRPGIAQKLAENIKSYGTHLTTGFLGTPHLCHVLTRFGYNDLAYELLNQKAYPSWLYPVTKGATTIWERWDGIKPNGDFQSAGMNSFNHYAYGAIGDWMYRIMAGLDTDAAAPGYKSIRIKPYPGGGFSHAEAVLQTPYGRAASSWKIKNGKLSFRTEIPANTSATIYIPTTNPESVKENGSSLKEATGVTVSGAASGYVMVRVGSGVYSFESEWKK